jgi:hypothetical protein
LGDGREKSIEDWEEEKNRGLGREEEEECVFSNETG